MNTHIIQAITVLVLTAVVWLAATFFVAKRAQGLRERRFVMRAGVGALLGIFTFTAIASLAFKDADAGFGVIMFVGFMILRRRQLQIRREEANV